MHCTAEITFLRDISLTDRELLKEVTVRISGTVTITPEAYDVKFDPSPGAKDFGLSEGYETDLAEAALLSAFNGALPYVMEAA